MMKASAGTYSGNLTPVPKSFLNMYVVELLFSNVARWKLDSSAHFIQEFSPQA